MVQPGEPVFLGGGSEAERARVRAALAAHPHFFTSHLPADDVEVLLAWARTMAERPSRRRPLWLSEAAFRCREALLAVLPGARFLQLVPGGVREDGARLELDPRALDEAPDDLLDRVFAFLGEVPLAPQPALRRCA
jgi:hypothetical protein